MSRVRYTAKVAHRMGRVRYNAEVAHRPADVQAARRLEVALVFSEQRAPIKCPRCGVVFIGGDFAHLDSQICRLAGFKIEPAELSGEGSDTDG